MDAQSTLLAPTATPPPPRKSAAIAWFASVVFPGAGQIYCGKTLRGVLVLLCVVAAGIVMVAFWGDNEASTLQDIALRIGLLLYAFAGLDAYLTAREINDGSDALIAKYPRVAAILNLTTRGFGYFYLGEHEKGIVFFFVLGVAGRMVRNLHEGPVGILANIGFEVALVVLAVDAYRIGTKKQRKALVAVSTPVEVDLGPAVPIGFASLVTLAYVGLTALALLA